MIKLTRTLCYKQCVGKVLILNGVDRFKSLLVQVVWALMLMMHMALLSNEKGASTRQSPFYDFI
jgi:hypothetical protein